MAERLYYITKADSSVKERSRCRKWFVRVKIGELSSRDKNGKPFPKWKTETVHGSYSDAEAYAQRRASEYAKLNPASNPAISACDYFDVMNKRELEGETRDAKPIEQNTFDKRRAMIKAARLTLKDKQLSKLTVEDLRACLLAARNGVTPSGTPYSESSMGTLKDTLSHFVTRAFEDGLISTNPALYIKVKREATHTDGQAIDDDLLSVLEASLSLEKDFDRYLYLLIISGGRVGELCALRWSDVSFKRCEIHIQRNITNKSIIKIPKTEAGNRIVPITQEQASILEEEYTRTMACGSDFVIVGKNGLPFKPNNIAKRWRRIRGRFDMEEHTLKDFRHTYATNLARAGATPKEIQTLMGHKDERIALRIYQHVKTEAEKRAAVERLNSFRQSLKK